MSTYQRFTLALMLTLKEEEIRQSLDKLHWTTNAELYHECASQILVRAKGRSTTKRARERERERQMHNAWYMMQIAKCRDENSSRAWVERGAIN